MKHLMPLILLACAACAGGGDQHYPRTRTQAITETLHGVQVADPYRWLEDGTSPEVQAWVSEQNAFSEAWLDQTTRDRARARLRELSKVDVFSLVAKRPNGYFYTHRARGSAQPNVYRRATLNAAPEVVVDVNALSSDGSTGLLTTDISPNGRYVLYGLSQGGDWETFRFTDTETGEVLRDELPWVKSYGWMQVVAWAQDSQSIFYVRHDAPGADGHAGEQQKLYRHRLGQPQSEDELILARDDRPELLMRPQVTEDGAYLIVNLGESFTRSEIWVRPVSGGALRPLIQGFDANYWFVGSDGPVLYFQTDLDAPRGRVIAIDLRSPERAQWRTVIPESDAIIQRAQIINNRIVVSALSDVRTRLLIYGLDGRAEDEIELPTFGIVADIYRAGMSGSANDSEMFFSFTSYLTPKTIYRYDFQSDATPYLQPQLNFDPQRFEVRQVFYNSTDGVRVPMFVANARGARTDNAPPLYLTAYGGFGIPYPPDFASNVIHWLEAGGVYAFANIRGGGEYGAPWHEGGRAANRQQSFDDFAAAAEYLVENDYTRRDRLAIAGWSNGGLLTAAALTQHPDAFGAVVVTAPLTDMMRYTNFTIGPLMTPEFGDPAVASDFAFLYRYSPYHNVRHTAYPPTFVNVGALDERAPGPPHSFKFAAALQVSDASAESPVLLYVAPDAGHVIGLPPDVLTSWWASEYAFLARALEIQARPAPSN